MQVPGHLHGSRERAGGSVREVPFADETSGRVPVGLDAREQAVVDALAAEGATPDRPFQKTRRLLDAVGRRFGFEGEAAEDLLHALAADWLLPVPLVVPHGNFGSAEDGPADPSYTEARLGAVGLLAAERTTAGPLPLGLINGRIHLGDHQPSFDPDAMIDAVLAACRDPKLAFEDLAAIVGDPVSASGCSVVGEMAALRYGERARIKYRSRIVHRPGRGRGALIVDRLPPDIGATAVVFALTDPARLEGWPPGAFRPRPAEDDSEVGVPGVRTVRRSWVDDLAAVEITLDAGVDAATMLARLQELWPITLELDARLPAPLGAMVRGAVGPNAAEQQRRLDALREAIALDRLTFRRNRPSSIG